MWRTRIGDITVHRVEEMLGAGFDPAFLFPDWDPAVLDRHPELAAPDFWHRESGRLMSSMQSWLLRAGDAVIIIDTGCGNGKARTNPEFARFHMLDLPYLERLAAYDVRSEDVTLVINTHLHVDHVGWNTRRDGDRWVPTFPNARYVIGRAELAHWCDPAGGPRKHPWGVPVIADSVDPVVAAGQAELRDAGDTILPGITLEAVPGHTAGQLAVRVISGGEAGLFTADVFHHPVQVVQPDWNSTFCELPDVARATRRRVLGEAADDGTVLFPSHTGFPHAGRVARAGDSFRFVPLETVK